jgi:hypothetical protein
MEKNYCILERRFFFKKNAVSVDRTRDLQIFSLTLSQLSYPRHQRDLFLDYYLLMHRMPPLIEAYSIPPAGASRYVTLHRPSPWKAHRLPLIMRGPSLVTASPRLPPAAALDSSTSRGSLSRTTSLQRAGNPAAPGNGTSSTCPSKFG